MPSCHDDPPSDVVPSYYRKMYCFAKFMAGGSDQELKAPLLENALLLAKSRTNSDTSILTVKQRKSSQQY